MENVTDIILLQNSMKVFDTALELLQMHTLTIKVTLPRRRLFFDVNKAICFTFFQCIYFFRQQKSFLNYFDNSLPDHVLHLQTQLKGVPPLIKMMYNA